MYKGSRRVLLYGGSPLILDQVAGVLAAFTPRKVFASGQPDPIEVRESGGGTAQVIGFSGNDLDQAALEAFCGANNGFVTKMYEASGSGNDAVQSTAVNQPQIVSSGSMLVTPNGKPRLLFDGANDRLDATLAGWTGAPFTVFSVVRFGQLNQPVANFDYVWAMGAGATADGHASLSRYDATAGNNNKYYFFDGAAVLLGPVLVGQTWNQFTQKHLSSSVFHYLWRDGVSQTVTDNAATITFGNSNFGIGYWRPFTSNLFDGSFAEIFIFNSDLSDGDRTAVENDQSAYWGTP